MLERILRIVITILALISSGVHFYLAISSFMTSNSIDALTALWLLNAVGYLCLLAAYLGIIEYFRGEDIIGYSLMVYAVITVFAWWNIDDRSGFLGWFTAVVELILVVLLFFHMRIRPRQERDPNSY